MSPQAQVDGVLAFENDILYSPVQNMMELDLISLLSDLSCSKRSVVWFSLHLCQDGLSIDRL